MEPTRTRIRAVRDVGPDAIALDLETPEEFDARPGQFVKLSLDIDGERLSRFYTLSSPSVEEAFEITVAVDPEGDVGPKLASLELDDTIVVAGPFGNAYYENESRTTVLAGGPGVGPAIGIAERTLADGGDSAVVYRDDEPIHDERLAALDEAGAAVTVLDGDEPMTDAVADVLAGTPDEQVLVYGFADFLDAATDALQAAGGDPDRAKVENFG
ncbi:Oxidoreductase FAD-binding domain protein [Halococcus morrhuae DSM 1307]|uniref:Oxidoreductase FAD-binding domain protein n=1 Tax=Halococcus morrhuae DSM 1307 TaxID=931277 RepID=M0MQ80_HALMO|nr:FAD-dependent oxidoreductase [Halococcus morrhuae]EMA47488.1 Oxidoreductase FAD-binding domain protein [Halococcus morrhuae DSM 1307]